jgi:hypothetical protein
LLPARLANACALVLPAAGVGIMFGEHVAAIPRPHTLTDASTVDLLFHHSRAQADLDFAMADEAIAQVKQTLDKRERRRVSRWAPDRRAGGAVGELTGCRRNLTLNSYRHPYPASDGITAAHQ